MQKIKLAFRLEEDDRFTVMARAWSQGSGAVPAPTMETTYDHEDLFLKLVVYADLDDKLTRELVVAVILSVAEPHRPRTSIVAEITEDQNEVLGLHLPPELPGTFRHLQPVTKFTMGTEAGAASHVLKWQTRSSSTTSS